MRCDREETKVPVSGSMFVTPSTGWDDIVTVTVAMRVPRQKPSPLTAHC